MGPDGAIALEGIRAFVEARLSRVPLLLRTLRPTRLGQGNPAWIDAPRFDVSEHVGLAPAGRPLTNEDDFLQLVRPALTDPT